MGYATGFIPPGGAYNADPTNVLSPTLGWSIDPANGTSTMLLSNAGVGHLDKIMVPKTITIAGVSQSVQTGGATLTASQCFIAIYDSSGNRLGISQSMDVLWTTTGVKTGNIAATITGGPNTFIYVMTWCNGTTAPTFRTSVSPGAGWTNVNESNQTARAATQAGPFTTAASSAGPLTLSANTTDPQIIATVLQ